MSAKFTPGPWKYTRDGVLDSTGQRLRASSVSLPCGYVPEDDDSIANARLIAAAPLTHSYIEKRATMGDQEARRILEIANGDS